MGELRRMLVAFSWLYCDENRVHMRRLVIADRLADGYTGCRNVGCWRLLPGWSRSCEELYVHDEEG